MVGHAAAVRFAAGGAGAAAVAGGAAVFAVLQVTEYRKPDDPRNYCNNDNICHVNPFFLLNIMPDELESDSKETANLIHQK
ncbi:hypothetical protein D3C75_672720 [compost metagenome]